MKKFVEKKPTTSPQLRVSHIQHPRSRYPSGKIKEKEKADEDRLLLGPISLGGRAFRGPNTTYLVKEINSCSATESVRQSVFPLLSLRNSTCKRVYSHC
jgi:hypothetical protein